MDFGNLACSTCTSAILPLGTLFENVPIPAPPIPYMSILDYIENVSLAGYFTLSPFGSSLWIALVHQGRIFSSCYTTFLASSARLFFWSTMTEITIHFRLFDSYTTTRTSDDFYNNNNNNNNNYVTMAIPAVIGDWSRLEDTYFPIWWTLQIWAFLGQSRIWIFEDDAARAKLKSNAI